MNGEKKGSSFLGAERKGFDAYILGETLCPYKDKRQFSGMLTWSRAYQSAWCAGYSKAAMYFDDIYEASTATCSIRFK